MSDSSPSICLIAPGHVASTPRLVKNADALVEAGYRVRVVCGRNFSPVDPLDSAIFARAGWSHASVDGRAGAGVFARRLLRRACQKLVARPGFARVSIAARAHQAETMRLAAEAARVPARLYFGHCLAGLPAAAFAARARGVRYGFDAEDFHDAETPEAIADRAESAARRILQARLLPGCALITAGSPLIGEKLREIYGVSPLSLLNAFPLSEAPAEPEIPGPVSARRPARIYWFSQMIGPTRGLEAAIAALALMRTPVELHLRGFIAPGYGAELEHRARQAGLSRPVIFHPSASPTEMVRLAASYDLGLSIEQRQPLNRDLCLGNKIFAYLLAGIPQLLSGTTAQTAFARELGRAAFVEDIARAPETAARLDSFFADPEGVAAARREAWALARSRFCWDIERKTLLSAVNDLLSSHP